MAQHFKEHYKTVDPHISESSKGTSYAFCSVCNSSFLVSKSGIYDVKRHCTDEFLDRAKSATYVGLKDAEEEEQTEDALDDVSGDVLRMLAVEKGEDSEVFQTG